MGKEGAYVQQVPTRWFSHGVATSFGGPNLTEQQNNQD